MKFTLTCARTRLLTQLMSSRTRHAHFVKCFEKRDILDYQLQQSNCAGDPTLPQLQPSINFRTKGAMMALSEQPRRTLCDPANRRRLTQRRTYAHNGPRTVVDMTVVFPLLSPDDAHNFAA